MKIIMESIEKTIVRKDETTLKSIIKDSRNVKNYKQSNLVTPPPYRVAKKGGY